MPAVLDKKFWANRAKLQSGFCELDFPKAYQDLIWLASTGTSQRDGQNDKWVGHRRDSLIRAAKYQIEFLGLKKQDRFLNVLPKTHIASLMSQLRAEILGASYFDLFTEDTKWDARVFADFFNDNQISLTSLVPTQVYDLVSLEIPAPTKKHKILVGGGSISPSLLSSARRLGWSLIVSYGASETAAFIAASSVDTEEKKSFSLKALPQVELKLDSKNRLEINYDSLFVCYAFFSRELGTVEFQAIELDQNSFWKSDDIAEFDGNNLIIHGRGIRFAKVMGENINLDLEESYWQELLKMTVFLGKQDDLRKGDSLVLAVESISEDLLVFVREKNLCLPGYRRLRGLVEMPIVFAENHKKLYARMQGILKTSAIIEV